MAKLRFLHPSNFVVATMIALTMLSACKNPDDELTATDNTPQTKDIKVRKVVKKILFREDRLPAEIEAYQDILIYPKVPGFIKWIGVDRGSVVKEGQTMVQMYAPEYLADRNEQLANVAANKANIANAESRLQEIEADLNQKQAKLLKDQSTYQRVYAASLVPGVIADNDVVQWSQTVEQDKQDVNTLMKRVNARGHEVSARKEELSAASRNFEHFADLASYLTISAPFNGYVTDRKMHVGSFVGPDGTGAYPPICRLKQLDLLRVITPVPQDDTAGIVLGSKVPFTVSAFPGKKFTGTVARVANTLDKDTRTMDVELNFLNADYKILPGMFCEVFWHTRRREPSLFVPIESVLSTPLKTVVCKIENNTTKLVQVRKAEIMNGMVEVSGDIKEGDLVAAKITEETQADKQVNPVVVTGPMPTDLFPQNE